MADSIFRKALVIIYGNTGSAMFIEKKSLTDSRYSPILLPMTNKGRLIDI